MANRKMPGLVKRGSVWHIKKRIKGYGLLTGTTGTTDYDEAQRYLAHRLEEIRRTVVYGERPKVTVREAAKKLIEESAHLRSLERTAFAFDSMLPYIGDTALEQLHDDTPGLREWKAARLAAGISATTINRDMDPLRRLFTLAARKWRHPNGMPYIATAPLLGRLPESRRPPYPLEWAEQHRFFAELPPHLQRIALFDVNTGLRDEELINLRWSWEVQSPELGGSVFVVPGEYRDEQGRVIFTTKNREERVVLLNDTARRVIDAQRGQHAEFVFSYKGEQLSRVLNSAWRKARVRAGLPDLHFHDLRHTFGHRLRAIGASKEDRKALLGHTSDDVTTDYSQDDLAHLLELLRKIERQDRGTVLRVVGTKQAQSGATPQSSTPAALVSIGS